MPVRYRLTTDVTPLSPTTGRWRFTLVRDGADEALVVEDYESGSGLDRLELLAVVRGLEAIDEPSHVVLITTSQYVAEGLARGLDQWRAADWQWEKFGQLVPIPQAELWQRIDIARAFHTIDVRIVRLDGSHGNAAPSRRGHGPSTDDELPHGSREFDAAEFGRDDGFERTDDAVEASPSGSRDRLLQHERLTEPGGGAVATTRRPRTARAKDAASASSQATRSEREPDASDHPPAPSWVRQSGLRLLRAIRDLFFRYA